jgi:DNA-binding SARP family transcriptional activator/tetratricopeptide (TPR) repeat protein/DNA-binding CsgD family transcriptional regulator
MGSALTANVSAPLRVELLGPPRAWLGQNELALGPGRQRAVFAVLALRAEHVVSRTELIDAVWGGSAPASAEGSVYTYVSGLRRNLEPQRSRRSPGDILTSRASGYALRLDPDALDTARFERLREQGRRQLTAGDHQAAARSLDTALNLWRGEALSGVPGPFAETQRSRLAELRLATIEQRAQARLGTGGHVELAAELAGLVQDHPLRESLRELLMIALYRGGRKAEALEVFRDARRVLVEELGIEPGPALRQVHEQILAGDPALDRPMDSDAPLSIVPAHVSHQAPGTFVGREPELARLAELVAQLRSGRGRSVWIEGDAGIGKSELLKVTLAEVGRQGCQLGWAVADELGQHFPLQAITECLGIDAKSPDPRRAQLAVQWQEQKSTGSGWGHHDTSLVVADKLLSLVDELCASAPLVLVVDDLQWADEASVLVWHRLCAATRQLPLLLVAATRPAPGRVELAQLRRAVESRDGVVMFLRPFSASETEELLTRLIEAKPGPGLLGLAGRAASNPLYVGELAEVLLGAGALRFTDGVADVIGSSDIPRSLVAVIGRRLDSLSPVSRDLLRFGALLGTEFSAADLAAVTGKQALELLGPIEEAVSANIVIDTNARLTFRHPLLREALYEAIPGAMRGPLHRQVAEALARMGAPVKRVAEQLVAAPTGTDRWVVDWLAANDAELSNTAPLIAVDLFKQALENCPLNDPHREVLLVALVKVLFRMGRAPEKEVRQAFAIARDPYRCAEMRQLLATLLHQRGEKAAAIITLKGAAYDSEVPEIWRARYRSQLANFRRGDLSDLDATEKAANEAYAQAVTSQEPYPIAHALQTLWLVNSVRRDHERALDYVDRALDTVGDDLALSEFRFDLLDNRTFTLQNLDRLDEAEATIRSARSVAAKQLLFSGWPVTAAIHCYWVGRWDDAQAELRTVSEDGPAISFYGLREPGPPMLLLHGAAALIAGRRDDRATAAAHLDAAENYGFATDAERENCDFLLMAETLAAEQRGEPDLDIVDPILTPSFAPMMLRHQWLPAVARLAMDLGDRRRAQQALAACQQEAAKEGRPARAFAAAAHCEGLLSNDPAPVLAAARHYRSVGRRVELASALEDGAVLLARENRLNEARTAFDEAIELFEELSARWDMRRAESRLSAYDIHRTIADSPGRPSDGWEALSPIEARVATLVGEKWSNPDIANLLRLPRRTVQAHVDQVLVKLNAQSRIAIIDEARRHVPHL